MKEDTWQIIANNRKHLNNNYENRVILDQCLFQHNLYCNKLLKCVEVYTF